MKVCQKCDLTFKANDWLCPACQWAPPIINGLPALAADMAISGAGFKEAYFQQLAALEDDHFWFKARSRLITDALSRFFPRFKEYMEIGCGTGHVLRAVYSQFPNANATGTEIFSTGLEFAQQRVPGAELLQMDARAIPYKAHFDIIGAFDVLEHIKEDNVVLAEIYKALRPGGGLVVTVPQHRWLWSPQDEAACHVRRYTTTELADKITAAGFTTLYTTSFVSLLLPAMLVSRMAAKAVQDYDAISELRINRLLNSIFNGAMSLERALIKLGVRFPIGGSLLLIAKRD